MKIVLPAYGVIATMVAMGTIAWFWRDNMVSDAPTTPKSRSTKITKPVQPFANQNLPEVVSSNENGDASPKSILAGDFTKAADLIASLGSEKDPGKWYEGFLVVAELLKREKTGRTMALYGTYCAALRSLSPETLFACMSPNAGAMQEKFSDLRLLDGELALDQFTNLLVDRFLTENLSEDLAERLKQAPLPFREMVYVSHISSNIADQFPASLAELDGIPVDLRRKVDLNIVSKLYRTAREEAMTFALNHGQSLRSEDVEVVAIWNDAWYRSNPENVEQTLLDAPPSLARDALIGELVRTVVANERSKAVDWIARINDPETAARVKTAIAGGSPKNR